MTDSQMHDGIMPARATDSWEQLFSPCVAGGHAVTRELRVVRRHGQPFLLLPGEPRLAAKALSLYPAQTTKARGAKLLLDLALRAGIAPRLEKITLTVAIADPFVRFLCQTANLPAGALPRFAILAGNPRAEGRRFIVLLFDAGGEPAAIVKAGINATARQLIGRETTFLQTAPPQSNGVPKLRGTFTSPRLEAFTLDFIAGRSPGLDDTAPLAALLTSWIAVSRLNTMNELRVWQRLAAASADAPLPEPVKRIGEIHFHSALMHGDLAPWNVRAPHGKWTVLDWERGEIVGVPAWDWFHFVIQPALLVRRETVAQLIVRFERLLTAADFKTYARHAGISGNERVFALAYLCYCSRVTKQTEGLERLKLLEGTLVERWFSQPA